MTKVRNQRLYSNDPEQLKRWAEEIEFIGGRQYKIDYKEGMLTIFALPQRKVRGKKAKKEHHERNKRAESAARRT